MNFNKIPKDIYSLSFTLHCSNLYNVLIAANYEIEMKD